MSTKLVNQTHQPNWCVHIVNLGKRVTDSCFYVNLYQFLRKKYFWKGLLHLVNSQSLDVDVLDYIFQLFKKQINKKPKDMLNLMIYLYIRKAEWLRDIDTFHLLIHSTNGHNTWGFGRMKPGALFGSAMVGGRGPNFPVFPVLHFFSVDMVYLPLHTNTTISLDIFISTHV